VLNFNGAPEGVESPNDYNENWWWPTSDQSDDYPGAQDVRDAYFLGFFAGITVETDDVVIDLNEHEIAMDMSFYYQQPYFSIIELESQPFLPQQGPGFFGSDPVFPARVTIKNGVLGLSSHHAIHGNWNEDIVIENVRAMNFQTHGIQLNGFTGLTVRNVEIGPSVDIAYLNGNYAHMRLIMPTLKKVAEDSDTQKLNTIHFRGRNFPVTMWNLLDKLVEEMDMAYNFAMFGTTYEDNEFWDEAVEMFINPSGLPMGAVLYGLFLNYPSAGIFGWHVNDQLSYDATVENVYIHDIRHKGIEVVGFQSSGRVFCNAFNGPLPGNDVFGDNVWNVQHTLLYTDDDPSEAHYVGSIVSDVHIAQYFWGKDDFDYWPGIPYMGADDALLEWATGANDDYIVDNRDGISFSCNEDAMFHPSKGLIAMKASGVEGLAVKNLKIENIQDETPLGSDLCGYKDKYHFSQQTPYQVGFSMNMVMGITVDFVTEATFEDVSIRKMTSHTGLVYGYAAWFESEITMSGKLTVEELVAGYSIDNDQFGYLSRPNKAAESCSIRLYDDETYPLTMTWDDNVEISQNCMQSAVGCQGLPLQNTDAQTNYNSIGKDDSSCEYSMVFDLAPNSIDEAVSKRADDQARSSTSSLAKMVRRSFGNKTVDVTSVLVLAGFVVVVLLLKMKFLWWPTKKVEKISSSDLTPLMEDECQVYQ